MCSNLNQFGNCERVLHPVVVLLIKFKFNYNLELIVWA